MALSVPSRGCAGDTLRAMPARKLSDRVTLVEAPYQGNAVFLYLVRGAKLALIDSGAADSPSTAVEPALHELGLGWSDLDYLLNTHGHPDHAGGNGAVKAAAPRVESRMHRADQFMLGGPEAHLSSPNDATALLRLLGREDLLAEREAVLRKVVGPSIGVERALEDGDVVDLGRDVRLRVTHTPGHTNGSVCFLLEADGTLFTGDAVQGHGWRAGMAPLYYDAAYVRSLDRIEALGPTTLCMGHTFGWSGVSNEPVRRGPAIAETLASSRRASSAIDAAVGLALERHGVEAPFPVLAEAAFRELAFELPVLFDRRTVVPAGAAAAIRAHLQTRGWQQAS
jgi:glyoxylase-like metal-dependent hydrolase (beta-lactamase superfamily II)